MSVLDWDGLVYYDKKIKKHIKDKISEAVLTGEGGTVDLTPYAKKVDVNASLDTKVDKVSGKSLVDDTEIARLALVDNYDDTNIRSSITSINSKLNDKANKTDLFSGSYNDLTDKPTIPNVTGKADKTYVDVELNKKANKTDLFSGSYNDLTDKPTIPDISNLATKTEVTTHTDEADIHITSDERTKWNSKLDSNALNGYAKTADVDTKLSDYTKKSDINMTLEEANNKLNEVLGTSDITYFE